MRRGDACIQERLDMFVVTETWKELFPSAKVYNMVRHRLDHCPITLKWDNGGKGYRRRRSFRFDSMWTDGTSYKQTIELAWNDTYRLKFSVF